MQTLECASTPDPGLSQRGREPCSPSGVHLQQQAVDPHPGGVGDAGHDAELVAAVLVGVFLRHRRAIAARLDRALQYDTYLVAHGYAAGELFEFEREYYDASLDWLVAFVLAEEAAYKLYF